MLLSNVTFCSGFFLRTRFYSSPLTLLFLLISVLGSCKHATNICHVFQPRNLSLRKNRGPGRASLRDTSCGLSSSKAHTCASQPRVPKGTIGFEGPRICRKLPKRTLTSARRSRGPCSIFGERGIGGNARGGCGGVSRLGCGGDVRSCCCRTYERLSEWASC